jgi:hypothetical protein
MSRVGPQVTLDPEEDGHDDHCYGAI